MESDDKRCLRGVMTFFQFVVGFGQISADGVHETKTFGSPWAKVCPVTIADSRIVQIYYNSAHQCYNSLLQPSDIRSDIVAFANASRQRRSA